jgi:hypothetical protein
MMPGGFFGSEEQAYVLITTSVETATSEKNAGNRVVT